MKRPTTLGIIGGGQLGQMLALAAWPLGVRCRVLDPEAAPPCSGIADLRHGRYDDAAQLVAFADGVDAVTFEFENVPGEALAALAARVPLFPPVRALQVSQDRLLEKQFVNDLGIGTSDFRAVDSLADLDRAARELGFPCVLKTRRLGYDGKGQALIKAAGELAAAYASLTPSGSGELILESFVRFARELSVLTVRGRDGSVRTYDIAENQHAAGMLRTSIAPAPSLTAAQRDAAGAIGRQLAEALDYVGVLAVELFETDTGLLVNEIAPRVHNSGHWTLEGAVTSQFENHVRAVLGLPLGDTAATGVAVMKNLIGTVPATTQLLELPTAKLHLYGKTAKPGRKLGHVTVVTRDVDAARAASTQLDTILAE